MNKTTKKKVKIILISFLIVIIPIGYLIAISVAIKMHNDALHKATILYPNDREVLKKSISTIEKAISIYPWNYYFHISKAELQMDIQDYHGALNSAKRATKLKRDYAEGFILKGYIYENLGQEDSAKICYKEAIRIYKKSLRTTDNYCWTSRNIALLYTIIGDSLQANNYLFDPTEFDSPVSSLCQRIDFYIEHYSKGGMRDYLNGETIKMHNSSITDKETLDSLLLNIRIYYDAISRNNSDQKAVYTFKTVFKDKAKTIGFETLNK